MPGTFGKAAGFSLVDTMVGLLISLLATLAIAQTLATFEAQKRTTQSGAGAQENGLATLHALDTDIRMAGYGFTTSGALACTGVNTYFNGSTQLDASLMPVRITDGGAGSDTIAAAYSNSDAGGVPTLVTLPAPGSSSPVTINSANGYRVGDMVLVAAPGSGSPCARLQITALNPQANGVDIVADPGTSAYNPPGGENLFPAGGYGSFPASVVFDMGTFVNNQYQVLCGTLTVTDLTSPAGAPSCTASSSFVNTSPVAANVVNIQAQYGIAGPGSQSVSCWGNATAGSNACDGGNWANPSAAEIARIKAVRIAVVVRGSLMEKSPVSFACTNVSGVVNNGPCAWPDSAAMPAPVIDLSSDANWRLYRYKVYQTIVPLRNILWANV